MSTFTGRPNTAARVICFTSGKGGVGKTHTVTNLALALAERGKSVMVLDADLSLANIDVLLGLPVRYTLDDFFSGERTLEEILIQGPLGITIIPASSGSTEMSDLSATKQLMLQQAIEDLAWQYDYLLVDTGAGVGKNVVFFSAAAHELVCIVNDEPTSLTDAYALLKILSRENERKDCRIFVNNVKSSKLAESAYQRLEHAVSQFLPLKLEYLGFCPNDQEVSDCVRKQSAIVLEKPSTAAARAIQGLAERIEDEFHHHKVRGGMQFFFGQLLEASNYGR